MNLSRSTYYYQIKNREKALEREKKDTDTKDLIDDIHTDFPYYGYRFLHEELKRRGHSVNTKKIRRLQRKFGLFPVRLRRFVRTTDSKHSHRIYTNLLKKSSPPDRINKIWVSDINLCEDINGFCVCGYYHGLVFKESNRLGCLSKYRQIFNTGSFEDGGGKETAGVWLYSSFGQRSSICL